MLCFDRLHPGLLSSQPSEAALGLGHQLRVFKLALAYRAPRFTAYSLARAANVSSLALIGLRCVQAMGDRLHPGGGRGGGRGRGRGRGPGKWTAAPPSAEFLASLQPAKGSGSIGNGQPPVILGPVAPPPVPFHLAPVPPPKAPLPPQTEVFRDSKQAANVDVPSSNKSAAQLLKERMLAGTPQLTLASHLRCWRLPNPSHHAGYA